MRPDFLIIGAQKCGTYSLFEYLNRHPEVVRAAEKEVHYFDFNFDKGPSWYESHFPFGFTRWFRTKLLGRKVITGEASPYYLFHPLVPERIRQYAPGIKFIVLLRNPVDRAYSHYAHEKRRGVETSTFEQAIRSEAERLRGEEQKLADVPNYRSFAHQHYSYLARGVYADQLRRWFDVFPRGQFLIVESEAMYTNPQETFSKACQFLRIHAWSPGQFEIINKGSYSEPMAQNTREELVRYFLPHNERLFSLLGTRFGW